MFSIWLKKNYRGGILPKFKIINKLLDLLKAENVKLYYSDYTFDYDESLSESIDVLENRFISEDRYSDFDEKDYFITIEFMAGNYKWKFEINPKISLKDVNNCSHIDLICEDGELDLPFFKENSLISKLDELMEEFRTIISEYSFLDLYKTSFPYSNFSSRLRMKSFKPNEFAQKIILDNLRCKNDRNKSSIKKY